jgi:transposase
VLDEQAPLGSAEPGPVASITTVSPTAQRRSSILEPLWVQFAALLPVRKVYHPLGCHRPRIPDRVVVDKLIQVLVFGCGYRRIADRTCSATTLRRRRDEWTALGVAEQLRLLVLAAYDRILGLDLNHLSIDGCITKAPCGGQTAGPSPVDRRKQGGKRVVERTHAWANQYGKLRWCAERRRLVVQFWLALAGAIIVLGRLIRRAWTHYRWQGRPRRRP